MERVSPHWLWDQIAVTSGATGLLIDGDSRRLSDIESFQNVCIIARVGAGKTSRYIIPNVLDKAKSRASLVVNDPKGEVFETTAATMARNGYRVIVIDPENIGRSSCFNPLLEAGSDIELEQIAEIIIRAGLPSSKDPFWSLGAIRLVNVLLKCLKNAGHEDPAYFTLGNLAYLLQNFGERGERLDSFVARYSVDPDDPADPTTWNQWKGALAGNAEGVQSFVLNAITALKLATNPNVARLTSASHFSLADLRREKTIIYFITPPQLVEYYAPLVSVFFRSVFNACMRELPGRSALPVYILYDEFGHSTIPSFSAIANTLRGYRASLSIVLQSIAQLETRYGQADAASIQGGFNSLLTYSGSDPHTAEFFSRVVGTVRERARERIDKIEENIKEHALMLSNQVRTIGRDEAILISTNRNPVKLKTAAYFENRRFSRLGTSSPPSLPVLAPPALSFVRL
jgi:type IV secretion system protein VirD4